MSDYLLRSTVNGVNGEEPFTHLSRAEAAFDALCLDPACSAASITGLGYEVARFVRGSCRSCDGRGSLPIYDRASNVTGSYPCRACSGSGITGHDPPPPEPAPPGSNSCPICEPSVPIRALTRFDRITLTAWLAKPEEF